MTMHCIRFNTYRRVPILVLSAAVSSACASVPNAYYAKPMDLHGKLADEPRTASGLVISGEEIGSLSSPYFGVIHLTFENTTGEWIHVRSITLGFGGGLKDASVSVTAGEELASWSRAIDQRNAIRRTNTATALEILAFAGTAAAVARGRKPAGVAGAAVAAGSVAALVAESTAARISAAESPYPEEHLLNLPFSVPPRLFTKRWITLNTKEGAAVPCIDAMLIDFSTDRGQHERVWLKFRKIHSLSEWQTAECNSSGGSARRPR